MKKLMPMFGLLALLILAFFILSKIDFNLVERGVQTKIIPQEISENSKDGHIILAVGDIAQCNEKEEAVAAKTAKLLDSLPGDILTLGDTVYPDGTKEDFETCFEPTWGRHKNRIFPSVGNHEYHTKDAEPYYEYFGKRAGESGRGYYSFNLGNWHLIAVNTQFMDLCASFETNNKCEENLEQMEWLEKDLKQYKTDCTLIFGHHPRFSSGKSFDTLGVAPLWELAYLSNVDVILAGHSHEYERFFSQNPQGEYDPERGIKLFIVGTGGATLTGHSEITKNSEVINSNVYGVLKLILRKGEYEWEFISTDGSFVDKGKEYCH